MEHQPYENWILSGDPLTESQNIELDEHLSRCPHCAGIKTGLSGVEMFIKSTTFASPSPGFTQRFKIMAAQREEELRRLQSYFFLGWMMIATVVVSIVYLTMVLLTQSPTEVVTNLMATTINMAFQIDNLVLTVMAWFQVIPLPITLAIIAGSASLVVLLTSGWVISVWKASTQGVKAHE